MQHEHLLAVTDTAIDTDSSLGLASGALTRGSMVTVLVVLGDTDRRNIADHAETEGLAASEAETVYEQAAIEAVTHRVGGGIDVRTTWHDPSTWQVLDVAANVGATEVVVSADLAARAGWQHAFGDTTVTVTVVPDRAA